MHDRKPKACTKSLKTTVKKKKKKKKPDNKGGQSAVSASDDRTEAENKPSASVVLTKRE